MESSKLCSLDRRRFLETLGVGLLGMATLATVTPEVSFANSSDRNAGRIAILYDASKCVGCHYCESGCRNANGLSDEVQLDLAALPASMTRFMRYNGIALPKVEPVTTDDRTASRWLRVIDSGAEISGITEYLRRSCAHCGLCAKVCPSRALRQRDDGTVTVEPDLCIGCGYCYQACPFDIPRYAETGRDAAMRKCTLCVERIDSGAEMPACVRVCPTGALSFGSYADAVVEGRARTAELQKQGFDTACLYGAEELGGTSLIYVLPQSYEVYGLPDLPS